MTPCSLVDTNRRFRRRLPPPHDTASHAYTQEFWNYFGPVHIFQTNFYHEQWNCDASHRHLFPCVVRSVSDVTWRRTRGTCCRSVTVPRRSFLISAAYSKPSSFAVSGFFLETLIHVRRPPSVSSVFRLVRKPLLVPVFVREWQQKYRPRHWIAHCSVGWRRVASHDPSTPLLFLFCCSFPSFFFVVGAFPKLRILASCPSVRPHGTSRLPLDGFWWNYVFKYSSKICTENSNSIKIQQK